MDKEWKELSDISETIDYQNLMRRRIRKILLVCSSYDGYILEEEGSLEQRIVREYMELGLSNPPSVTRVDTTAQALDALRADDGYDFILTMYNVGEPDVFTFARMVRRAHPGIPVVLLVNFSQEITRRIRTSDCSGIDYVFGWHGNADLILAIVKLAEDRINADNDILEVGVQAILLVEDSVRYYSSYLPVLYKLVLQQSGEFVREAVNERQRTLCKRARPKILLATNYDEAVELYERYKENLLGVISDVGFVVHRDDPPEAEKTDAGLELCRMIREDNPLMPILLQSSQEEMRLQAERLGVGFLAKYSKTLLLELGDYIRHEFAFGDFVVRGAEGGVIARAKDLSQLQRLVAEIPEDVLRWHGSQNNLSKWMFSRGLFSLGAMFRGLRPDDFASVDEMRRFVVDRIHDYRIRIGQGVVARFDPESYNETIRFARIGQGSLGGKARGLAFADSMLHRYGFYDRYPGVRILVPRTVVVATDYFDDFIRENGLQYVINADVGDAEILSEFVSSRLPQGLVDQLAVYIRYVKGPLAIRSSSKLEDSYYQPFAGIYSTYMIPYTDNPDQMLRLLGKAIKSVYASVYFAASRAYITASANVLSEEKMAVVVQEVCGSEDGGYFFPAVSGVARSVNFYPIDGERPEDGIANIAFGLGKVVVEGGETLRFVPRYPKKILQLSTPDMARRETQKKVYALDLRPEAFRTSIDDAVNLHVFTLPEAAAFRSMRWAASTWDAQGQRITDAPDVPGPKLITFAPILRYGGFPLAQILSDLLEMGRREMHSSIEMEFAVNLDVPPGEKPLFEFLQIRPIAAPGEVLSLDWSQVDRTGAILYAEKALGAGAIPDVSDIVYVRSATFDNRATERIAAEVTALNERLREQSVGYVLVGPGRWGSSDPFLGIPVKWPQISEARVIVECGLEDFRVEPSQGTHFFQNLTSFGVGYLTINPFMGDGSFDEAALDALPAVWEGEFVRHVRFPQSLYIFVDGRNSRAIVRQEHEDSFTTEPGRLLPQ